MGDLTSPRVKVITIAVGGATCSGKTTLAKHLRSCLYNSFIVHQDDFAPPQEQIPIHPQYNVQDWDDPHGAIEWPRLAVFLKEIKRTGILPASHKSHDHLNENKEVPVDERLVARWRAESERIVREREEECGERIVWAIADGFLMYWDQDVIDQLDIRVFLRVPYDVLQKRRHERHGYHTAEGTLWRDPPSYFEQIVYPAYVRAHAALFEGGDVEVGQPTGRVAELMLFEGMSVGMREVLEAVMERVVEVTGKKTP